MFATQNVVVELTINEPLDIYQVLRGKIVRPIKSLKENESYHLFQDENGKWWVIKPRYSEDRIEEIYLGKRIQVAIAAIIDQDAITSNGFRLNQVDYLGIGAITRAKD